MSSREVNGSRIPRWSDRKHWYIDARLSQYLTLSVLASWTRARTRASMLLGGLHNLVSSEDILKISQAENICLVQKENMAPCPLPNSFKYNHLTNYSGVHHFIFSAVDADIKKE